MNGFGLLLTITEPPPALEAEPRPGARFSAPYGEDPPLYNAWQWDSVWADGDFYKGGMGGQGLHVSPARDVVLAFFGTPVVAWQSNELEALSRRVATRLA
jgi:hypothetical protein